MDLKSIEDLKENWNILLDRISGKFGVEPDLQGIIFLIGVQELGKGSQNFSKSEKQDLMHIATCRLLSTYGYYELDGLDDDGWPHWKLIEELPVLTLREQDLLLKKAAINYFKEIFST